MSNFVKQAFRFSFVGVINTAITLGIIFILTKLFNFHYVAANIVGYVVGLINSFLLNRKWTFRSSGSYGRQGFRFLQVFAICYMFQLGLLILLKEKMYIDADYSQAIAMIFYTGVNFLLSKFYTFKRS